MSTEPKIRYRLEVEGFKVLKRDLEEVSTRVDTPGGVVVGSIDHQLQIVFERSESYDDWLTGLQLDRIVVDDVRTIYDSPPCLSRAPLVAERLPDVERNAETFAERRLRLAIIVAMLRRFG
jgi:hypothetical protein